LSENYLFSDVGLEDQIKLELHEPLTAVSLFAGVGGFDLAMERNGINVVATVEIDKAARGVLQYQFPNAQHFNDVTEVTSEQLRDAGFVPDRGIITGGFPCQDLSVAGKRTGLGGSRSGLFWEIIRLANELRPKFLILENVPGLLSSVCPCDGGGQCVGNGRASECLGEFHQVPGGACEFGCFESHGGAMGVVLGAVAQLGYGVAYRVLDARYFGVPQRRRRVFIVGCLGDDGGTPGEILALGEGVSGDTTTRRETRKDIAGTLAGGSSERGYRNDLDGNGTFVVFGDGRRGHDQISGEEVPTLQARMGTGGNNVPMVTVYGETEFAGYEENELKTLTATQGKRPSENLVVTDVYVKSKRAASDEDDESWIEGEVSPTLNAMDNTGDARATVLAFSHKNGIDIQPSEDEFPTLKVGGAGQAFSRGPAVRRLTPTECERLQGFPDGWTSKIAGAPTERTLEGVAIAVRQVSDQSDSARYKQMGNAVAVPVVEWLVERLLKVAG
jgi:DNA (cytosine-5)-methyltransferase 1